MPHRCFYGVAFAQKTANCFSLGRGFNYNKWFGHTLVRRIPVYILITDDEFNHKKNNCQIILDFLLERESTLMGKEVLMNWRIIVTVIVLVLLFGTPQGRSLIWALLEGLSAIKG